MRLLLLVRCAELLQINNSLAVDAVHQILYVLVEDLLQTLNRVRGWGQFHISTKSVFLGVLCVCVCVCVFMCVFLCVCVRVCVCVCDVRERVCVCDVRARGCVQLKAPGDTTLGRGKAKFTLIILKSDWFSLRYLTRALKFLSKSLCSLSASFFFSSSIY